MYMINLMIDSKQFGIWSLGLGFVRRKRQREEEELQDKNEVHIRKEAMSLIAST